MSLKAVTILFTENLSFNSQSKFAYNSIQYKKSHFEKFSKIIFFCKKDEFGLLNIFRNIFSLKKLISLFRFSLNNFQTSKKRLIEGINIFGSLDKQVLNSPSAKVSFTIFIKFFFWEIKLYLFPKLFKIFEIISNTNIFCISVFDLLDKI